MSHCPQQLEERSNSLPWQPIHPSAKRTTAVLRKLMDEPSSSAYKMINGKGELISRDVESQAELLKEDGFVVDNSKSKFKIKDYKEYLFH